MVSSHKFLPDFLDLFFDPSRLNINETHFGWERLCDMTDLSDVSDNYFPMTVSHEELQLILHQQRRAEQRRFVHLKFLLKLMLVVVSSKGKSQL